MPTLYVENIPDDLYKAIRARAKANRGSIASEVLDVLSSSFPAPAELARRKAVIDKLCKLRPARNLTTKVFPSAEEMLQRDRER